MAVKGMLAYAQLQDGTVNEALLDSALTTKIAQITTNTTGIQAINDAKGAAGGFAPLNANTKLPTSYLEASALAEYKGEAADEAAMTAITAVGPTDWVFRQDSGTIYFFTSGDSTVAANWKEMTAPNSGVLSINGQTGNITLADVASSGAATDLSGLAGVATSGNASDLNLADAGNLFDATTVEAALAEAMTAANDAETAAGDAVGTAVNQATLVQGTVTGPQNGTNKDYTISGVDVNKPVFFYRDGNEPVQAGFASRAGATVTFTANAYAPDSSENLAVVGYPN